MSGTVALGIAAGSMLTAALVTSADIEKFTLRGAATLVGYTLFMLAVCLTACVVPTLRALRVQPTEALRAEG